MVWELLHRLRLFPKKKYLSLKNEPLTLETQRLDDSEFTSTLEDQFKSRGQSVARVDHNWKVLFINDNEELLGCLYPEDRDLYKSVDNGKSIVFLERFPERIKSIFVSSQDTVFVCVKGAVYRSADGGNSFEKTLDLGSSESFFRHNNGMTETPSGALVIAEYGNVWNEREWKKLAYLYFSSDDGETWDKSDFLIKRGINKHVHLVRYSRLLNKVFMADGDNYKKLWVSDALTSSGLQDPSNWKPITKFHIQMGGYTAVTETDGKILFGTDYQGGTNFVVESSNGEKFNKRVVPDPYRRSPIMNMVQRKSKRGNEIWAYLPYSAAGTKCLLMYSADEGQSWNKVVEYSKASHKVWLINSSNDISDVLYFSVEDLNSGARVVYEVRDP
jgi:photosystem II stability/assembly factor-like uncharacterized protein